MNKLADQVTVIKITEKHIVVLCANGQFKNIPRDKHEIPMMGETIQIPHIKSRLFFHTMWMKSAALASVIIMVLIAFSLIQTQNSKFQPSYIIAIDINPSIELYMDKDFIVKEMKALNDDGESVIKSMEYIDKPLLNIVDEIMNQSVELGYLSDANDGLITAAIISNEQTEIKLASNIKSTIEQHLSRHQIQAEITISEENMATFDKAQQLNISVNKYVIYDRMNRQGFNIQVDEIAKNPIASLLQMESTEKNNQAFTQEKHALKESEEQKESKEQKDPKTQKPQIENKPNQNSDSDEKPDRDPSQTKPKKTNDKTQRPQQTDSEQIKKEQKPDDKADQLDHNDVKKDTTSSPESEPQSDNTPTEKDSKPKDDNPLPKTKAPEEVEQVQSSDGQTIPQNEKEPGQQAAQEKKQVQEQPPQPQTIKEEKPELPK